jgi:GNAT superfamily N-acetyltransferase
MKTTRVRNNVRATERVVIRPLTAADSSALVAAFEHLSPETRRLRFMSAGARLTKRDADRLTDIDHRHSEALAAIAPTTNEIIGVARYFELQRDPGAAEVAVTVDDDWQGQGIGRRLITELVARRTGERDRATRRLCRSGEPARHRMAGASWRGAIARRHGLDLHA